jgi:hypothetical protein
MVHALRASVVAAFALGAVVFTSTGQQPPAAKQEQPTRVEPVAVPTGDGAPVITDGVFTPGEWDDALTIPVADGVTLFLKEYRGVVFVGIRGATGPSDLYLAPPGGPIEQLHVSAGLAQVLVPTTGPDPTWRLGFTTDWYANEQRRDDAEFERMREDGRDPMEIMRATTYPFDGIEFAIRRSKIPGRVWLMRFGASALVGGRAGAVEYPPAVVIVPEGPPGRGPGPSRPSLTTNGWLELRFK